MQSLYELLKASKGLPVSDSYAALWGKSAAESGIKTLTGTLPMTFRSNGTALINYRIFGTAEGVGVQTEQHGYKIPLTVSGTETKTIDVYIGDSKLGEAEYVDYSEQKIYRRILFMTHDDKHFITKDNKDFCLRRRGYSG